MDAEISKGCHAETVPIIPEFYQEGDELANAVLKVEEQKLHVSKELLMLASPVFKVMLTRNFKETATSEVLMEGKKLQHVIWMLDCIYPNRVYKITDETAAKLLPLAHEYQMHTLVSDCAAVLEKLENPRLEIVTLAEKYDLTDLLPAAISACALNISSGVSPGLASYRGSTDSMSQQLSRSENHDMSNESQIRIYREKLSLCYTRNNSFRTTTAASGRKISNLINQLERRIQDLAMQIERSTNAHLCSDTQSESCLRKILASAGEIKQNRKEYADIRENAVNIQQLSNTANQLNIF